MTTPTRYVRCACGAAYARTLEHLATHAVGAFKCDCGAALGAWNGLVALRYTKLDAADRSSMDQAARISAAA